MAKNYKQSDGIMASALPNRSDEPVKKAVDSTTAMVVEPTPEMTTENKAALKKFGRKNSALDATGKCVEKPMSTLKEGLLSNKGKKSWNA